jgi:hypothetical protein
MSVQKIIFNNKLIEIIFKNSIHTLKENAGSHYKDKLVNTV